jgi:hypothetical protein
MRACQKMLMKAIFDGLFARDRIFQNMNGKIANLKG